MKQKKVFSLILALVLILTPVRSFAESIRLDGSFDDWSDKPYLADSEDQNIKLVRWYPDLSESMLYFYCEREKVIDAGKNDKYKDWNLEISFDADGRGKKAYIHYHPPSSKVEVGIFDAKGQHLWGAKGKWGEDKYGKSRIEFFIPLNCIAGSIEAGYQVNCYFTSENDRLPDNGSLTISTVSTFPVYTVLGAMAFAALMYILERRRRMHEGSR